LTIEKVHRLFFALVPNDAVRAEVARVQSRIDHSGRAVPPANFHVTLAFLGMQPAAVIPDLSALAGRLRLEPCRVVMDQVGRFSRAGVMWLGASALPDPLRRFQQDLLDALQAAGVGHDPKPWTFHLTLYRRLRKPFPTLSPVAIEWSVKGFDLVESAAAKKGVEYHSIGHWPATGRPLPRGHA
jgi:2'-5' RNA ligase